MRKYPLAGVALIILGSATAAHAQGYDKDNDRKQILGDAQYVAPESSTRQESAVVAPAPETPAQTQPAAGSMHNANDFTGPYIGGDVGYDFGRFKVKDPAGPDGRAKLNGIGGGLFGGYGMSFGQSGYAGVELGYELSGADDRLGDHSYEKKHNWLATFRPGINLRDSALAYAIVGYSRAKFKGAGDEANLNGLVLGLGTEANTGTPVKARLEYAYTNYGDAHLSGIDLDGHEHGLRLGLVYRFF